MKKFFSTTATLLLGLFLFSNGASAHVTVKPSMSTTNAWETYTVTVPVEKEIATTKVTLQIPSGVQFELYRSMPEWTAEISKDEANKEVSTITWTANKDGIQPGQFEKFEFMAKNPNTASTLAWKAIQYYSDGTSVSWTGEKGSPTPYSITAITAKGASQDSASTDNHSHNDHADHADGSSKQTSTSSKQAGKEASSSSSISTLLSAGALLISCAALWVGLRRSK
ncbi:uncharacterized protein YcnI [Paenibacillus turicensis]|uniref:Uncharacterized protein YcnI n=1 Tax=Paenibacillus turicensis TaxID=160487 RepID=A0ABS4FU40_9BACL|nr:YcnI family protein [Paenibacillus turicensis]MBP1906097.1 uncharacterized protein YcnI [Paenibacillus turicensis]